LALRRLEARGIARGGRFVTGFTGEQYALPEAVDAVRKARRLPRDGERVVISAADPLNLVGILTPGARVPASANATIVWCDGDPETGPRSGSASNARRIADVALLGADPQPLPG
jgi:ATP-dependent Lhr-like helicase